jgi:hypothetical protein
MEVELFEAEPGDLEAWEEYRDAMLRQGLWERLK